MASLKNKENTFKYLCAVSLVIPSSEMQRDMGKRDWVWV